ncbi:MULTISPECIES: hypothetical protein [unclassified Streptomyces]
MLHGGVRGGPQTRVALARPVPRAHLRAGPLGGVLAEQIVEAVPLGRRIP